MCTQCAVGPGHRWLKDALRITPTDWTSRAPATPLRIVLPKPRARVNTLKAQGLAFLSRDAARAGLEFSYSRDPAGAEIVLYNCDSFPGLPREKCIPRAR